MTFQVDFNDVTRTVVQLNPIHISINCSKFPTSETSSMYISLVYLLVLFYSSIGCYEWISEKKKINYNLIILTIDFCLQFIEIFWFILCVCTVCGNFAQILSSSSSTTTTKKDGNLFLLDSTEQHKQIIFICYACSFIFTSNIHQLTWRNKEKHRTEHEWIDWNRNGNGKRNELLISCAFDVINYNEKYITIEKVTNNLLCCCCCCCWAMCVCFFFLLLLFICFSLYLRLCASFSW